MTKTVRGTPGPGWRAKRDSTLKLANLSYHSAKPARRFAMGDAVQWGTGDGGWDEWGWRESQKDIMTELVELAVRPKLIDSKR